MPRFVWGFGVRSPLFHKIKKLKKILPRTTRKKNKKTETKIQILTIKILLLFVNKQLNVKLFMTTAHLHSFREDVVL